MEAKPSPDSGALTHVKRGADGRSESQMVDVGSKTPSDRRALARAKVRFPSGVLQGILEDGGPKGPILEVSRVAGLLGAKRTAELIPMCHPLGLHHVELHFSVAEPDVLEVRCSASVTGPTGVEMEAMVGASLAALTLYDMTKGVDKGIVIETVELLEKSGGKSGTWSKG
ncbi:MAG: cyclic pyranopterin monophosphate synthase MoaC [Sulfitobacter sp.]|nr:cyclic pyranopterin monophosphate synthase MoaC [Sulfitobacter sp.]